MNSQDPYNADRYMKDPNLKSQLEDCFAKGLSVNQDVITEDAYAPCKKHHYTYPNIDPLASLSVAFDRMAALMNVLMISESDRSGLALTNPEE